MNAEEYWVAFTRTQDFPREVGAKDAHTELAVRTHAINSHQFVDFIKSHNGKEHCFMGLFSKMQKMCKIYDTIFFDIDAKSLDVASQNAHTLIDAMKSAFRDASPRVSFSGKKGYHVFYDIEPTYVRSYNTSIYSIAKRLKFDQLIDCQMLSDSILCRLPYTVHMSTNRLCIPILARHIGNMDAITYMSEHASIKEFKMCVSKKLSNELRTHNAFNENTQTFLSADKSEDPVPLCVSSSYDKLIKGTAEHVDRVFLAMYMLNAGAGIDCAISIFKSAPDYVLKQTRYQVDYTYRKKLKIYGCRTLIRNGICPLDGDTRCLCNWFPNMYKKLKIYADSTAKAVKSTET